MGRGAFSGGMFWVVCAAACGGGATLQAGGTRFAVSEKEAGMAHEYERTVGSDPRHACDNWKRDVADIESPHAATALGGIVGYTATSSDGFKAWANARRDEACAGAAASSSCGAPLPNPERRYLAEQTTALPANPGAEGVDVMEFLNPPPYAPQLPPNTSLDVIRLLRNRAADESVPDAEGCPFALVRIVDAGGDVQPGRLYAVPRKVLAEHSSGLSAAEQAQRGAEKQAAAAKKMAGDEVTSGRCSEAHVDVLQQGLVVLASYLETSTRSANNSDIFELGAHAFAVATDTITPWSLAMGIGGEEHIFAVAFAPFGPTGTTFEVVDDQGYPVKTPSRLAQMVFTAFNQPTTGYVLQANAHQTLKMNLKGHGCVLLVAIRRD